MRLGNAPLQFVFGQRLGVKIDIAVAGRLERFHGGGAHAFEQQYLDVLLGK